MVGPACPKASAAYCPSEPRVTPSEVKPIENTRFQMKCAQQALLSLGRSRSVNIFKAHGPGPAREVSAVFELGMAYLGGPVRLRAHMRCVRCECSA